MPGAVGNCLTFSAGETVADGESDMPASRGPTRLTSWARLVTTRLRSGMVADPRSPVPSRRRSCDVLDVLFDIMRHLVKPTRRLICIDVQGGRCAWQLGASGTDDGDSRFNEDHPRETREL